jgi:histidine ammonia-lyase
MGSVSARKLQQVVCNVRNSLAIEILTAAAGLDQRAPLVPSKGVAAAHAAVRELIAPLTEDRPLYGDIATVAAMISGGSLARAAEALVGPLA